MSKYNISIDYSVAGSVYTTLSVNPKEFLYCDSENEVRDAIEALAYENVEVNGLTKISHSELSLGGIEEFINEWKELKSYES